MAAARKSMQLDRQNPEGYMAIAGLLPLDRYAEREELLKKAISVRPTECGCERQAYGDFLASVGRMEEAVGQYERARAMRPLAPFSNLRFAQALYVVGRNDEADRILADTLELWPDATSLRLLKMKSALWTRRYDEAIALLGVADLPLTSTQRSTLTAAFQALKSQDAALRAKSVADARKLRRRPALQRPAGGRHARGSRRPGSGAQGGREPRPHPRAVRRRSVVRAQPCGGAGGARLCPARPPAGADRLLACGPQRARHLPGLGQAELLLVCMMEE